MNYTDSDHPVPREASLREAGIADLFKDVSRLGPAPNASRELFATAISVCIVAIGIRILPPAPVVTGMVVCGLVALVAIRWVLGVRKWAAR